MIKHSFLGSSLIKSLKIRMPLVKQFSRDVSTDVNALKKGMLIDFDSKYYTVVDRDHSKTGRGSAKIKIELSQVGTHKKRFEVFKPGDVVDVCKCLPTLHEFLYSDDSEAYLLNPETSEELSLPLSLFSGEKKHLPFLEPGMNVYVDTVDGEMHICFRLPSSHVYEVESVSVSGASPIKGNRQCPAVLKNGAYVSVPDFIKAGDKIQIDLQELKYLSRA